MSDVYRELLTELAAVKACEKCAGLGRIVPDESYPFSYAGQRFETIVVCDCCGGTGIETVA